MQSLIPSSLYAGQLCLPGRGDDPFRSPRISEQQFAAAQYLQQVLGRTASSPASATGAYDLQPWIASAKEGDKSAPKPLSQVMQLRAWCRKLLSVKSFGYSYCYSLWALPSLACALV